MPHRIYFDNAATTAPDPRVLEAMRPHLDEHWGNPSSLYAEGRQAPEAVDRARAQVAALLGADPREIVFTGSGTEADNMAVQGVLLAAGLSGAHLVTSAIEHPAILACCRQLERLGATTTELPVSSEGLVDAADLEAAIRPQTRLVSVMAANNVTGVIQPIAELAEIAHRRGAIFHTDAVQAVGKTPLDVRTQAIDLLSLSGHKLHGPKGVGALYIRDGIELWPLLPGGGRKGGDGRARRTSPRSSDWAKRQNSPPPSDPTRPATRSHSRPPYREHPGEDRKRLPDRSSLAPLARAYLPRFRRLGRRSDQAAVGTRQAGHRHFIGQRVQRDPRRPALPRVGGLGVRSAPGPRLAEDSARAVQYDGRGRPLLAVLPRAVASLRPIRRLAKAG